MKARSVIFLDIDGVLTSHRVSKAIAEPGTISMFDPIAIRFFERISDEYNPHFVVSSSWRDLYDKRTIIMMLKAQGAFKTVMNIHLDWCTARLNSRGIEIQDWVKRHQNDKDISGFIIIDDANVGMIGCENDKRVFHVQTTEADGMLLRHYDQTERLLNK